jgi:hypothetical protein
MKKLDFGAELAGGVELAFIKKNFSKDSVTYSFVGVDLHEDVAKVIKGFLKSALSETKKANFSKYSSQNYDSDNKDYMPLEELDAWRQYKNKISTIDIKLEDLPSLRSHLYGYVVYQRKGADFKGYIRRLTPRHVLLKDGLYKIFFKEKAFNRIEQDQGVQIDEFYDVVFGLENGKETAAIFNKKHFKELFNVYEVEQAEAVKKVDSIPVLKGQPECLDVVRRHVSESRLYQKMLANKAIADLIGTITIKDIKTYIDQVPGEINFKIENNKIILDTINENASVRSLIRVVTYYYKKSIDGKHIFGGSVDEKIK